jgi:hypothetical protein
MPAVRPVHTLAAFIGAFTILGGATWPLEQDAPPADPPASPAESPASPVEPPASAAPDATAPPRRVVIFLSRRDRVMGTVEREDADLIVIRTPEGELQTHLFARIVKVVPLVDPAPDQRGRVVLSDGTMHEGVVLEDSFDRVTIAIEGVPTRFERRIVDHVELFPTFDELYAALKAAIAPSMHTRRLELCQWLIDQGRFDLAEVELLALRDDKPDTEGLSRLLRLVQAQLALNAADDDTADDASTSPDDESSGAPGSGDDAPRGPVHPNDLLPTELLSQEDVNLIRVYEIDFDKPPVVEVPADTIRSLLTAYGSHDAIPASSAQRNQIFQWDSIDVVRLMFDVRARDLYSQIKVVTEPHALNLFRQRVHNAWLIPNCATSRCHGGVSAGRLFLHSRNYKNERVRYTNLLILNRLELDPSKPLINFEEPVNSLIIQHALPITEARFPHPDVPGWKPVFSRGNTEMLDDTLDWLRAMHPAHMNYPIEYEPPKLLTRDPQLGIPGANPAGDDR